MIETKLTDYDGMNEPTGEWKMRSPAEVVKYLDADLARNAVLFRLEGTTEPVVAVWGGENSHGCFFIQRLPLDDPGDAIPIDGTAADAILEAIRELG